MQRLKSDPRRKQAHEAIQQALGGPILIPLVVNGHPRDIAKEWPQYKEEVQAELIRGGEGALVARWRQPLPADNRTAGMAVSGTAAP